MTSEEQDTTTFDWTSPPEAVTGAVSVVLLSILYHRDLARIGDRAVLYGLDAARPTQLSRDAPAFERPAGGEQRPLADASVSRSPVRLTGTGDGGVRIDPGESRTRISVRGEPIQGPIAWPADAVKRGVVLRVGQVVILLHRVEVSDTRTDDNLGIVGDNPAIYRVRREIRRVADLATPVLVRGETGTGKDLVARGIHAASARREGPFVAVNIAAVPPSLATAELFGAERGAYTGASRERPGYFAMAHGGTLFLDEIGDAPADVQVLLLRAIETGEVQAVGAGKAQKLDVRLVAATDADLEAKVRDGTFRAPLLHRLSVHEIRTPPLRERRDDIARLLLHFLREELGEAGEAAHLSASAPGGGGWLPASLVARLADLDWAGNVRQLRNVARQIATSGRGADRIEIGPAIERLLNDEVPPPSSVPEDAAVKRRRPAEVSAAELAEDAAVKRRKPAEVSAAELAEALRAGRWDLAAAASLLGIPRASVYMLIRRSGSLRTAGDLSVDEISRCHRECGGDIARMVDRLEVSEQGLRRRIRDLGLDKG